MRAKIFVSEGAIPEEVANDFVGLVVSRRLCQQARTFSLAGFRGSFVLFIFGACEDSVRTFGWLFETC